MNPHSADMMKTYYTYKALKGMDENCAAYIEAAELFAPVVAVGNGAAVSNGAAGNGNAKAVNAAGGTATGVGSNGTGNSELQYAVVKGMKERAAELTKKLLGEKAPLDIVNGEIIPALNIVGVGFEEKKMYLPQLLMSAEAAKSAFEVIKQQLAGKEKTAGKAVFVIATVKGDIHDIGKNIVKLLLENYGYDVVDLGKDVPPETVVEKVIELHAPFAGLSALMTTTVPAMEETIKLIKEKAPWCKTVVGGAVLTQEYADRIGADKYAKDAMEAVRYAETY